MILDNARRDVLHKRKKRMKNHICQVRKTTSVHFPTQAAVLVRV